MVSAMAMRYFSGVPKPILHVDSFLVKTTAVAKSSLFRGPGVISLTVSKKQPLYVKASENMSAVTANAAADTSDKNSSASVQKKNLQKSSFPSGFQTLVEEVCDQTDIAELKLKVGDFEMLLKRDIGIPKAQASMSAFIESPTTAPPIPSKPMEETVSSPAPIVEQKPSAAGSSSPFNNISIANTSKLAALEATGQNAYVLVSSPTVGSFRRGRTVKGKKQPPSCKEGDIIKEGQIIGFLDQFGNELPVRSDVAGEVLKILYNDGEPVGYGDPLVAVLPSFHISMG